MFFISLTKKQNKNMTKNTSIFVSFVFIAFIIVSCNKDEVNEPMEASVLNLPETPFILK